MQFREMKLTTDRTDPGLFDGSAWLVRAALPEQPTLILKHACGGDATPPPMVADTLADDPGFYAALWCDKCQGAFPVREFSGFAWPDLPAGGPKVRKYWPAKWMM